jgi:hypothetical protein
MKKRMLTLVCAVAAFLAACPQPNSNEKPTPKPAPSKDGAKAITGFTINGTEGTINEAAKIISISLPFGTNVTALAPLITVSPLAAVSPASGTARDFSTPQSYTVTAQDGTTAQYTVTVNVSAGSGAKAITGFTINSTEGTISAAAKTIGFTFPYGTNVTALAPLITVSPLAAVSPASGTARNFSTPQSYIVTAQDGTTAQYTVTVSITPNHEKAITSFSVNGVAGTINEAAKTIIFNFPYKTSLTALVPLIAISPDAVVNPASGVAKDFTAPQIYTVTAQNGDTQEYTVTISVNSGADTGVIPPPAFPDDLAITQNGSVLSASAGFSGYQWFVDGIPRAADTGSGGERFTPNAAAYGAGKHRIRLAAFKNGVPYSAELLITL